jgi:hypothetical protein
MFKLLQAEWLDRNLFAHSSGWRWFILRFFSLAVFILPWHSTSMCFCIPISSHKEISHIALVRANPNDLILNKILPFKRLYLQNQSQPEVLEVKTSTYILGKHNSAHEKALVDLIITSLSFVLVFSHLYQCFWPNPGPCTCYASAVQLSSPNQPF